MADKKLVIDDPAVMYQDVADSSSPLQLVPQGLSGSLSEVNTDMGNVETIRLVKPLEYRTRR